MSLEDFRKKLDAIKKNQSAATTAPIVPIAAQPAADAAAADAAPVEKPKNENSIWVGNLDASVSQDKLENYFSCCGKIKKITLKSNPKSGKYAYIEFDSLEAANLAINTLNNNLFCGKNLKIKAKRENVFGMTRRSGPRRSRH